MLALGRQLPASGWILTIVALSLVSWLCTLIFMAGMDGGPAPASLAVFLVGWIVMLTAMMLPSELVYVGVLAALLDGRAASPLTRHRTVACFVAGYAVAWIAYGLAAYLLTSLVRLVSLPTAASYRIGPLSASVVLIVAGLYQVSALKGACLTHCRAPQSFFARNWRKGELGALTMGVRHGLVCVGCCWALMAVMFVVGAMSLTWMALLTVVMFAEKVLPQGQRFSIPIACFLCVMGLWIGVSPESAPLFRDPFIFGGVLCRSR